MAAPKGNKNAVRGTEWRDALRRALDRYDEEEEENYDGIIRRGQALARIATVVVKQALLGGKDAIQEISNRLDGKAHQSIEIGLSANTAETEMSDVELDSELGKIQELIAGEKSQTPSPEKPTSVH